MKRRNKTSGPAFKAESITLLVIALSYSALIWVSHFHALQWMIAEIF